jgi:hypothetical protein
MTALLWGFLEKIFKTVSGTNCIAPQGEYFKSDSSH